MMKKYLCQNVVMDNFLIKEELALDTWMDQLQFCPNAINAINLNINQINWLWSGLKVCSNWPSNFSLVFPHSQIRDLMTSDNGAYICRIYYRGETGQGVAEARCDLTVTGNKVIKYLLNPFLSIKVLSWFRPEHWINHSQMIIISDSFFLLLYFLFFWRTVFDGTKY